MSSVSRDVIQNNNKKLPRSISNFVAFLAVSSHFSVIYFATSGVLERLRVNISGDSSAGTSDGD